MLQEPAACWRALVTRGVAISDFFREAQRFQLRHILQIDSLGCMIFGHRSRGVYFPQASEFDFGFGRIGLLLGHVSGTIGGSPSPRKCRRVARRFWHGHAQGRGAVRGGDRDGSEDCQGSGYVHSGLITIGAECASGDQSRHRHMMRALIFAHALMPVVCRGLCDVVHRKCVLCRAAVRSFRKRKRRGVGRRDIRSAFGDDDVIRSSDLVAKLTADPERPWAEWKHGRPLRQKQLAGLLAPFHIISLTVHPPGLPDGKGYRRTDFKEAWAAYCPGQNAQQSLAFEASKRPNATETGTTHEFRSVPEIFRTVRKTPTCPTAMRVWTLGRIERRTRT